ncbi:MAG: TonB-dependent siderophore receptor [Rhodothalassiaceae bacterium]
MNKSLRLTLASATAILLVPGAALAQSAGDASAARDTAGTSHQEDATGSGGMLEEIVVTAVLKSGTRMTTSVSTSALSTEEVRNFTPRSTAEIFRNIPGIRSESSGGGGNANIAVRGLPISTGGAKFLSLQEDGLPVLQFGDIAFGNADNFLRFDSSLARIEAVRGGSASTFAQNSPGGVINLISKTGTEEGGSIYLERGVNFDRTRVDFEYGGPLAEGLRFHVGGFYRVGEGTRNAGFTGDNGGQIKANVTKEFDRGFFRVYFKHLDDKAITYLPMPLLATGTNSKPRFRSVPGFDAKRDTPHTPFLLTDFGLGGDNNFRTRSVKNGIRALTTSVGIEFEFDLPDDWTLHERGRYADNSGGFISPFPANIAPATTIAETIGGPGATLAYAANGPGGGMPITNPAALNGNGLAMTVALFDVDVNNFNNFANDVQLRRSFELAGGRFLDLSFGYFRGHQNIDMDWVWNSFVLEVQGKKGRLLDVRDADGTLTTINGLFQFGDPFGGCCQRSYDLSYDTDAPYGAIALAAGPLTLDASVRWTFLRARGNFAGTLRGPRDMNGDGVIAGPEENVSFIDNLNQRPVDYSINYGSYSVGGNYLVNDDLALFARYSRGASANADRLPFGPSITPDGSLADKNAGFDVVRQAETGVKYRTGTLNLFGTFFYARTEETNFELTSQTFTDRSYRAYGFELEGAYSIGHFDLSGGFTWTDAKIRKDRISPELVGNTPRRQADVIYQLTPSYSDAGVTVGVNIIGTTSSFAQFNNELKLPGYAQVNLFALYELTEGLVFSVNVNNLFDALGVTEAEEGAIAPDSNTVIRARAINGRTASVSLRYSF